VSATTNYGGADLLYVFSSSTEFDADKSYSKFAAYAVLEHGGDFSKAALHLFKEGYGDDPIEAESKSEPEPRQADPPRPDSRTKPTSTRSLRATAAKTIVLEPVYWLWDERIPLGSFSLIGGREGIGKSILVDTLAASVSTGTLPGVYCGTPKGVLIAATEDSWAHTIAPRLSAAGADLERVFRVDIVDAEGFELPLSLPKDTAELAQTIKRLDAALVIFDPLLSRLDSRLDSHKDADTRRALEPLAQMATLTGVAVLGLIHVNKSTSSDALTLLMASRAFAAVARAVLFVAVDPDNEEQRLLGQPKNNLGRMNLPTLLFHIKGVLVASTANDEEVWTGQLVWSGESDQTIRQVLERAGEREGDRAAIREAAEWLVEHLTAQGGTAARKTIIDLGRKRGYSRATLDRARHTAHIQAEKRGFPATSYWMLPPSSSQTAEAQSTQSTQSTQDRETGNSEATDEPSPSVVQSTQHATSPEPESTESTESTGPELFQSSPIEQQWQKTDTAFKKGWQS
jgi:archaellum biogenesis ATPase FlaH